MFIGSLVIYIFGLFWLVQFTGESSALQMGLFPFLVGDLVKILIGVVVLGGSKKMGSMISSRG
jgi:biotin transporter BioY